MVAVHGLHLAASRPATPSGMAVRPGACRSRRSKPHRRSMSMSSLLPDTAYGIVIDERLPAVIYGKPSLPVSQTSYPDAIKLRWKAGVDDPRRRAGRDRPGGADDGRDLVREPGRRQPVQARSAAGRRHHGHAGLLARPGVQRAMTRCSCRGGMVAAGDLNRMITLRAPDAGQDDYGQPLTTYHDVASIWASYSPSTVAGICRLAPGRGPDRRRLHHPVARRHPQHLGHRLRRENLRHPVEHRNRDARRTRDPHPREAGMSVTVEIKGVNELQQTFDKLRARAATPHRRPGRQPSGEGHPGRNPRPGAGPPSPARP